MPELPEVETVMRGLRGPMLGRKLVRVEQHRPDLRWPLPEGFVQFLTGCEVAGLRRRGKYIFITMTDGRELLIHLGMSGRMLIFPKGEAPERGTHDHIVFVLGDGTIIRFQDPRRFGFMDVIADGEDAEAHRLIAGMGPEPLGDAFSAPYLLEKLSGKRTPIKSALLDQKIVAGLGNIYVCEALYRAGIAPERLAADVRKKEAKPLVAAIKDVLEKAIAAGGSSLRDYVQTSGELGYFQHAWAVYGREGEQCPDCTCEPEKTGGVQRIVQSGRSSFFCAARQR